MRTSTTIVWMCCDCDVIAWLTRAVESTLRLTRKTQHLLFPRWGACIRVYLLYIHDTILTFHIRCKFADKCLRCFLHLCHIRRRPGEHGVSSTIQLTSRVAIISYHPVSRSSSSAFSDASHPSSLLCSTKYKYSAVPDRTLQRGIRHQSYIRRLLP